MEQEENNSFQETQGADKNTVALEDYKKLQAFWTKAQQSRIALASKIAELSPSSIAELDEDIRDKVVKKVFWYDTYEDLLLLRSDIFEKKATTEDSKYEALLNRVNKSELENELDKILLSNPELSWDEVIRTKVLEEIQNISSNIPNKDRIERAIKIVSNWKTSIEALFALQGKTFVSQEQSQKLNPEDFKKALKDKIRNL